MLYPSRDAAREALFDALSLMGTSAPREYAIEEIWERCYEPAGGGAWCQFVDTPTFYRVVLAWAYPPVPGGAVEMNLASRHWSVVLSRGGERSVPYSGRIPVELWRPGRDGSAVVKHVDDELARLGWVRGHESPVGDRRAYSLLYRPRTIAEGVYEKWLECGVVRHDPTARARKVDRLRDELPRRARPLAGGLLELSADGAALRWSVVARGTDARSGRVLKESLDSGSLPGVLSFGFADLGESEVLASLDYAVGVRGWRRDELCPVLSLAESPAYRVSYMPRSNAAVAAGRVSADFRPRAEGGSAAR